METWRAEWESALDELELTLEQTERLLAGEVGDEVDVRAWTRPTIEVPLPADMLGRVQDLLRRQRQLSDRTALAMTDTRKQMSLVNRMAQAGGRQAARPVYVDQTA